jgi:hypothetical protein
MKIWYSARELAGLRGMPTTSRNVNARAKREGWEKRKRERGKGWEYSIHSLPLHARAVLLTGAARQRLEDERAALTAQLKSLDQTARELRTLRVAIRRQLRERA